MAAPVLSVHEPRFPSPTSNLPQSHAGPAAKLGHPISYSRQPVHPAGMRLLPFVGPIHGGGVKCDLLLALNRTGRELNTAQSEVE